MTLHVRQDGPQDAPTPLLIHGFGTSTSSWDPLVPLLTHAHHAVRIDLLGHGKSPKPDGPHYGIPDHARRAGEVLDRLGIAQATIVATLTDDQIRMAMSSAFTREGYQIPQQLVEDVPA